MSSDAIPIFKYLFGYIKYVKHYPYSYHISKWSGYEYSYSSKYGYEFEYWADYLYLFISQNRENKNCMISYFSKIDYMIHVQLNYPNRSLPRFGIVRQALPIDLKIQAKTSD